MGFSFGNVEALVRVGSAGHLMPGAQILDLGSQNFYGEMSAESGRRLFGTFSKEDSYHPDYFKNGSKIDALMEALGFKYVAFDMFEGSHTRKFDFNFDTLTPANAGQFDLVMNLGTSEHVCNQFNFFRVAHDALKVGGLLYNNVPFFGGPDHALFNYHPKFFTSLIANNAYEPIIFELSEVFESQHWDRYVKMDGAEGGPYWEAKDIGMAIVNIMSKKTVDAAFVPPTDAVGANDIAIPTPSVNDIITRISRAKERPLPWWKTIGR